MAAARDKQLNISTQATADSGYFYVQNPKIERGAPTHD